MGIRQTSTNSVVGFIHKMFYFILMKYALSYTISKQCKQAKTKLSTDLCTLSTENIKYLCISMWKKIC